MYSWPRGRTVIGHVIKAEQGSTGVSEFVVRAGEHDGGHEAPYCLSTPSHRRAVRGQTLNTRSYCLDLSIHIPPSSVRCGECGPPRHHSAKRVRAAPSFRNPHITQRSATASADGDDSAVRPRIAHRHRHTHTQPRAHAYPHAYPHTHTYPHTHIHT